MKNNIIFSTYFTSKPDIQRGQSQLADDFDYIAHWYTSMMRLGLNGIIFHDELSDDFVQKYSNENISFERTQLGDLSTNDERFFIYKKYLSKNKYENVFMTDISDVWFKKNPFVLIDGKHDLYIGSEKEKIYQSDWLVKRFNLLYGQVPKTIENNIIYNAGIIGGKYIKIIEFLDYITKEIKYLYRSKREVLEKNKDVSFNMTAFNMVLYNNYNLKRLYTNKKLHSPFKEYLKEGSYYIFHK